MKMPWSFLTRRRAADPSPNEIAEVKEAFQTEDASDLAEQPPAALQTIADDTPTTSVEGVLELAGQPENTDDERSSIELPGRQTSTSRKKSSPRSGISTRRIKYESVGPLPANPLARLSKGELQKKQPSVTPIATDDSHSSALALDGEINQLRRQLANKLSLQNDQLKQMLRRFDPS
jgi:hypothetical protein